MNRFFVPLEYDVTKNHCFQKQQKSTKTIQHHLNKEETNEAPPKNDVIDLNIEEIRL